MSHKPQYIVFINGYTACLGRGCYIHLTTEANKLFACYKAVAFNKPIYSTIMQGRLSNFTNALFNYSFFYFRFLCFYMAIIHGKKLDRVKIVKNLIKLQKSL